MRPTSRRHVGTSLAVLGVCVCGMLLVASGLRNDSRLTLAGGIAAAAMLIGAPVVWVLRALARVSSGGPQIHAAINEGDIARVREMLAHRPALVRASDGRGSLPLHRCALEGQDRIAGVLIAAGADVDAPEDQFGFTPLHVAACWGYRPVVSALHPEMDRVDFARSEARDGGVRVARLLLDHGARVGATDRLGRTPLHMAALAGQAATARLLLERGAEANRRDAMRLTPLHHAALGNRRDVADLILEAGGDPNAAGERGHSPLHTAAERGALDVARLLLERGARPDARTSHGRTALSLARLAGHEELAALLAAPP